MKGDAPQTAWANAPREGHRAVAALLVGALVWGLIWYPYRILRDLGVDGVAASTATYAIALVLGLLFFRRPVADFAPSWLLFWLALAAGVCNLGYVLATLNGNVLRVLLLFYLAPLWTVLLSRLLLDERLDAPDGLVIALSLGGAAIMLWQPQGGLPLPRDLAEGLGLLAGFAFALFNVLCRRAWQLAMEIRVLAAFVGVVGLGLLLLLLGVGDWRLPPAAGPVWPLLALVGGVLLLANRIVQFGLTRVAANRAIVIMLSEIPVAALAAWLLAGEIPAPRDWLGGSIIVTASLLSARQAAPQ
ncbi:MAG: DMT family transporter [Candidatus Accumulibacter sp. UW26]